MGTRAVLLAALLASGCGLPLLPTTLFYAPLAEASEPETSDWSALIAAAPSAVTGAASSVVASERLGDDEWMVWTATATTDAAHVEGSIVRARRTAIGLEAQAIGAHVGPAVRVTLRTLEVDRTPVVVLESSVDDRSIERSAWVYVVRGREIVAAELEGEIAYLAVHRDSTTRIDERWDRTRTVTATFEGTRDALVVHEHATVREVARDRPEIPPRAIREIDRDRRLVLDGTRLVADRTSLFDE